MHIGREGRMRHPLAGRTGSGLLEHAVDLLERETLGLGHEEVGEGPADAAKTAPHEEDVGAEVGVALAGADEVGGDCCDDLGQISLCESGRQRGFAYAVPEPIGGGGETDTTGTDGEREDLADDDPGSGAPGGSEEEDVQADEGNHGADSGVVVLGFLSGGNTDDTDDELHDDHTSGAIKKDGAATESLNDVEGNGSGAHVDERGDQADEEGVADRAELGEEHGSEVEDEVDTGKLLHHLHANTEERTAQVGVAAGEATLEAVGPATEVAGLRDDLQFVLVVGDDLSELVLDIVGLDGLVTNGSESGSGTVEFTYAKLAHRLIFKRARSIYPS
jgi:hypothetical protein